MTRHESIHTNLHLAREAGLVTDYYCYGPGDGRTRWAIWGPGYEGGRTLTTREVEAFLLAANAARYHRGKV